MAEKNSRKSAHWVTGDLRRVELTTAGGALTLEIVDSHEAKSADPGTGNHRRDIRLIKLLNDTVIRRRLRE